MSICIIVIAAWHADPISFSQTFFSDTLVTSQIRLDFGTSSYGTFTATYLVANDGTLKGAKSSRLFGFCGSGDLYSTFLSIFRRPREHWNNEGILQKNRNAVCNHTIFPFHPTACPIGMYNIYTPIYIYTPTIHLFGVLSCLYFGYYPYYPKLVPKLLVFGRLKCWKFFRLRYVSGEESRICCSWSSLSSRETITKKLRKKNDGKNRKKLWIFWFLPWTFASTGKLVPVWLPEIAGRECCTRGEDPSTQQCLKLINLISISFSRPNRIVVVVADWTIPTTCCVVSLWLGQWNLHLCKQSIFLSSLLRKCEQFY